MTEKTKPLYAQIKHKAVVYIEGVYHDWMEKNKILRVESHVRKNSRMRLIGKFTRVVDDIETEIEKSVQAWFVDLVFVKSPGIEDEL